MNRRWLFGLCAWMALSLPAVAQPSRGELRALPPLPSDLLVLAASEETIRVDGALHHVAVARVAESPTEARAVLARACIGRFVTRDDASSCLAEGEVAPRTVFFVRGDAAPATILVIEIDEAIPADIAGDVPGSDLVDLPRPARARRVVSAEAEGGEQIVSYVLGDGESAVPAWQRSLREAGWDVRATSTGAMRLVRGERTVDAALASAPDGLRLSLWELP